jgi:Lipocalin-like domain
MLNGASPLLSHQGLSVCRKKNSCLGAQAKTNTLHFFLSAKVVCIIHIICWLQPAAIKKSACIYLLFFVILSSRQSDRKFIHMKLFFISIIILFLTSCKKESAGPATSSYNKIFGTWYFVSYQCGGISLSNSDTCLADNIIEFRKDTTGYMSQGACMENPNLDKDKELGKWTFKSQNILKMDGVEVEVIKNTANELWFKAITGAFPFEYKWKR